MAELYKLINTVKHYAWGSPSWIPSLMGEANPKEEPWAELWMGIHPGGPSKTTVKGKTAALSELTELPFLFKFLAAESPLSIQAHPNLAQAREGFERENRAGIDPSAPERNYHDPNHKPEIVCALTPFTAMAGFREREETERLLSAVPGAERLPLYARLRSTLQEGYRPFLSALFGLNEAERKNLNASVLAAADRASDAVYRLCGELAGRYPNDPGILSPLYLNVIELKPREAIVIPAGILHAYVHGFALECMANSDNVLRGGLTPKHIDVDELLSILTFDPFMPDLLKPEKLSHGCYGYKPSCKEFSLYLLTGAKKPEGPDGAAEPDGTAELDGVELDAPGKGIAAVCEGAVKVHSYESGGASEKTVLLNRGESVFIERREPGERLIFTGDFTLFAALVPD